ncbi:hypothetical protein KI688_008203 [Linnemannia hyalina]|uniref:t-SNARE coiled-coil homology domain-containing protein n=1 Tax=Linnemannia hyalina TaxID=64524 RepID=A0A9P7Y369_9FUNG|nr:hypothetical protein KI688_008203 [Linnemannia hyalina]
MSFTDLERGLSTPPLSPNQHQRERDLAKYSTDGNGIPFPIPAPRSSSSSVETSGSPHFPPFTISSSSPPVRLPSGMQVTRGNSRDSIGLGLQNQLQQHQQQLFQQQQQQQRRPLSNVHLPYPPPVSPPNSKDNMKNKSPIAHHSRFVDENTRIDTPRPTLTPTTAADAAAAAERIGSPEEDQNVPSTTTTTTTSSTTTTTTVPPRSPQSVLTSFQGGSQSNNYNNRVLGNNYNNRVLGNNNSNHQRQVLSPPTSPPQSSPLNQQYQGFIRVDNRGPHDSGATSMSATSSSSGVGAPSSARVPKSSNRIDTYQHEGVSIDIDPSTTHQQQAAASSSSSSSSTAVVTTSSVFPTSSTALQEQELDYNLMVRHLSQQIFNISSNIAVLERLVPCLGQRHKDTVEMRAGLHAVLDGTHELVKSAHGLVKVLARYHQPPSIPHSGVGIGMRSQQQRQQRVEMSSWQKKVLVSRRQTHQKLTKDLALVSKDFQVLQREAIEAERCQVAILRRLSSSASMRRLSQRRSDLMDLSPEEIQALGNSQGSNSSGTSHGLSNTSFPGLQVFHHDRELSVQEEALLKELLAMDGELAMQENILQERESEIRKIEVGMVEVLDVMKELGTLVHEQRGGVDFLQDNIMQARGRIQQGQQEIVKASEHQRKYREKMCYLLMIASTVGAIVMLAFVST